MTFARAYLSKYLDFLGYPSIPVTRNRSEYRSKETTFVKAFCSILFFKIPITMLGQ